MYALGGAAPLYDAIFKTQERMTRPYTASPGKISKENFNEHLGDRRSVLRIAESHLPVTHYSPTTYVQLL